MSSPVISIDEQLKLSLLHHRNTFEKNLLNANASPAQSSPELSGDASSKPSSPAAASPERLPFGLLAPAALQNLSSQLFSSAAALSSSYPSLHGLSMVPNVLGSKLAASISSTPNSSTCDISLGASQSASAFLASAGNLPCSPLYPLGFNLNGEQAAATAALYHSLYANYAMDPIKAAAVSSLAADPQAAALWRASLSQTGVALPGNSYVGNASFGHSYHPYAAHGCYTMSDLTARRKNATRESTSALKAWLYEHRKNPYPTKGEKIMLAIITKMTLTQVSTWFANARRRLKKENKMTWSPRNRNGEESDDDNDDNDDDDEGEGLRNARDNGDEEPHSGMESGGEERTENSAGGDDSADRDTPKARSGAKTRADEKPKIWSLVDTATKEASSAKGHAAHVAHAAHASAFPTVDCFSDVKRFTDLPVSQILSPNFHLNAPDPAALTPNRPLPPLAARFFRP